MMREISFVKRLEFNFNGSVTKKALVIGDADNDKGDLAIFKGKNPNRFAYATELGMVTACVVGDVINAGRNYVSVINTEGWLFLFHVVDETTKTSSDVESLEALGDKISGDFKVENNDTQSGIKLTSFYEQRMPANCKELLLADLDGDGQNEVIVGLTDRVLRTYKWIKIAPDKGKFVGLYKWEFADQIGAVSLNPSRFENCQDIIVAQPGGTYAKLECFDKKTELVTNEDNQIDSAENKASPEEDGSRDNVRTEYINKLTPEYHQLALSQMRNHHISTEVLGGIRHGKKSDSFSLIVIATLDGTLMLVNKDEILWSLQVDHQLFALAVLESKVKNHSVLPQSDSTCTIVPNIDMNLNLRDKKSDLNQYFIACAWNGKTYIIDEERNYLRFKFDEAVSAFTAGNYYFDEFDHASLVYATFNNQIILYYDVILDHIRPMYLLNEVMNNSDHEDLLTGLKKLSAKLGGQAIPDLLRDILYNFRD